jgi:hypothetical protein
MDKLAFRTVVADVRGPHVSSIFHLSPPSFPQTIRAKFPCGGAWPSSSQSRGADDAWARPSFSLPAAAHRDRLLPHHFTACGAPHKEVAMAALISPASATKTMATNPGSSGAPRARLLHSSPCARPCVARAQIRRDGVAVDGRHLLRPLEARSSPLLQSLEGRAPLWLLEGRPCTRRGGGGGCTARVFSS